MPTYSPYNLVSALKEKGELVFISDMATANDSELLDSLAVTHIITLNHQIPYPTRYEYYPINIDDAPNEDIFQYFDDTYEFIEQSQQSLAGGTGYSCLVHCAAGVSRSASIVLAYIMRKLRIPLDTAIEELRRDRPCIEPNLGFLVQLRAYQFQLGIPDSKSATSHPEPVFESSNKLVSVYNNPEILFSGPRTDPRPVTVYTRFPLPDSACNGANVVLFKGSFISVATEYTLTDQEPMIICVTEEYTALPLVYSLLHNSQCQQMSFDEIDEYLAEHYPALRITNKYTRQNIKRYYDGELESLTLEKLCQIRQIACYMNPTNAIQLAGVLNTLERMDTFNLPEVLEAREALAERIRGYLDI
jgi:protein-tyrosine phosphatase